jgi:hypothetical protein
MVGQRRSEVVSVAVVCLLAAFALPSVALVWAGASGAEPSGTVMTAVLLVPLPAITVGLGVLARKVGSRPDGLDADRPKIAAALGTSTDAHEEQFEEEAEEYRT